MSAINNNHSATYGIKNQNITHTNFLSRIEREYISFLYDNALRTKNEPITISEIEELIKTPEGQRGLQSFKAMRKPIKPKSQSIRAGEFL